MNQLPYENRIQVGFNILGYNTWDTASETCVVLYLITSVAKFTFSCAYGGAKRPEFLTKVRITFKFSCYSSFSLQIRDIYIYSICGKCRRRGNCNELRNAVAFLNVLTRKHDTLFRVGGASTDLVISNVCIRVQYKSENLVWQYVRHDRTPIIYRTEKEKSAQ
jgi:hypothetical protein